MDLEDYPDAKAYYYAELELLESLKETADATKKASAIYVRMDVGQVSIDTLDRCLKKYNKQIIEKAKELEDIYNGSPEYFI